MLNHSSTLLSADFLFLCVVMDQGAEQSRGSCILHHWFTLLALDFIGYRLLLYIQAAIELNIHTSASCLCFLGSQFTSISALGFSYFFL